MSVATVDLSDESGNLKYLVNHPLSYASEILKERESFVLIRVESKFVYAVAMLCPPAVYSCVKNLYLQFTSTKVLGLKQTFEYIG